MPPAKAGRTLRSASLSTATRVLDFNIAGGMWQATGTAIAHGPNLTDLKSPHEVDFDANGHYMRRVTTNTLGPDGTGIGTVDPEPPEDQAEGLLMRSSSSPTPPVAHPQGASKKALLATWRFLRTPAGLLITIYGASVIAWGAMLFFLLLDVGPMPNERKDIWIEVDSQILNALFCLTAWGLAPWRLRDMYWLLRWRFGKGGAARMAIGKLAVRNGSWFRRDGSGDNLGLHGGASTDVAPRKTLTGKVAPPTAPWKMDFVVVNMLLNSVFQVGMASFMWAYDRHDRPSFGVGLFIGLGCFSSLLAGGMSWWEGRKVKRVEGAMLEEMEMEMETGGRERDELMNRGLV
ncbi:DUF2985 domain-containing protein [Aspergillus mulundensis]|uniref:Alpha-L-rhamnosidase C n=1 Tax=Aspergillus mulundensis TaxID=1810919 RepID=A0A3D8REQ5_9EURO|nr:hypothetical protein DSM5745_07580 [Aspergillus mulundensis]RDW72408.1 hypothetical protein DSM5745_07580 [Aspergillus mulundensis]